MGQVVDVRPVSTEGLESSPVADALASTIRSSDVGITGDCPV